MQFCIAVFVLCILPCIHSQRQRDEAQQNECVRLWLQKRPDLLTRFNQNHIRWLCQRTDEWMTSALNPGTPLSDSITEKQMDFLNKLRGCQGSDCLKSINCVGKNCPGKKKPAGAQEDTAPGWVPAVIGGSKKPTGPGGTHQDALSDADPFDTVNETLILATEADKCDQRFWLAYMCQFVLNATGPEEVFPEEYARKRLPADAKNKLKQRYDSRKAKCERARQMLTAKGQKFEDIPNCNDAVVMSSPKAFAQRCQAILDTASKSASLAKTAWNYVKSFFKSGGQSSANTVDQAKYAEWLDRCRQARDRLQEKGMTFDSLLKQLTQKLPSGKRRKRDEASPLSSIINDAKGQFADLLMDNKPDPRAQRKEYRMLSDDERKRYHAAINKLKTEKIDTLSKYDLLVIYHTPQEASGAHWGPAFLPFHREFMKQYEIALRQVDPSVALPYWDTTLDEALPTPADSIIWTNDFLGTREGVVTQGPFANWTATQELSFVPGMKQLFRGVGTSPFGGLYKESDLEFITTREKYEDLTACVDPTFELVHGIVHMFVGGYMADIGIAPNDPAFYMHHCFIDFVWEEFRQAKQTVEQRQNDYAPEDKACNNFHFASSQMKPFSVKNSDGLSNNYTKEIFFYQPRPRCSEASPTCSSPYIFCNKANYRCMSKVQANGNCTGFEGTEICYNGACQNGKCIPSDEPVTPPTDTTTTPAPPGPATTTPPSNATTTTLGPVTTPPAVTTTAKAPATNTTTPQVVTTTKPVPPVATTTKAPVQTTTPPVVITTKPMPPITTTTKAPAQTTTPPVVITTKPMPPITTTTKAPAQTTATPPVVTTTKPAPATTTSPAATTPKPLPVTTTRPPVTTPGPIPPVQTTTRQPVVTTTQLTSSPTFPATYFTITIIRGSGANVQPVTGARVKTFGLNSPAGYTQAVPGAVQTNFAYPSYLGATVMRVYDPTKLSGTAAYTSFGVEILDESGQPCSMQCYDQQQKRYGACPRQNQFRITTNTQLSDPFKYYSTEREALEKPWALVGTVRQRQPDYILVRCPTTGSTQTTPTPALSMTYFTITVIRGRGYDAKSVQGAKVTTTGLNSPVGYKQITPGVVLPNVSYPNYAGATMMRVPDPTKLSAGATDVSFSLEVLDETGRPCRIYCYNEQLQKFSSCPRQNNFRISTNTQTSDPIQFYPLEKDALEKPWVHVTNFYKRHPDYILSTCPSDTGETRSSVFPRAYFTITVIRGTGSNVQSVIGAKVKTTGLNVPAGYTDATSGIIMSNASYPSYPGAAITRVYDPSGLGPNANVQFSLEVLDPSNRPCPLQCYNQQQKRYGACPRQNQFRISTNAQTSDPIKFYLFEREALERSWSVSGRVHQRQPDYILSRCP